MKEGVGERLGGRLRWGTGRGQLLGLNLAFSTRRKRFRGTPRLNTKKAPGVPGPLAGGHDKEKAGP